MSNFLVTAKAEVFDTEIDAFFHRQNSKEQDVNIKHKKSGGGEVEVETTIKLDTTKFLVFGHPDTPTAKTLKEIIKELTTFLTLGFSNPDALLNILPDRAQDVLQSIRFSIRYIYFLKEGKGARYAGKQGQATKEEFKEAKGKEGTPLYELLKTEKGAEYALWIDVNLDPELFDGIPIKVTSIGFKVWKTHNKFVIKGIELEEDLKLLTSVGIKPTPAVDNE